MPFTQTPIPGRKLQNVLPAGTALILEGGGLRGYYSAGVMEAFLEKDMLFPYIIGVSAGAANALSYISGQAMRSRQIIEHYVGNPEYVSRRNLLRKGSMFGFDYIFQTIPEQHIRFDWDAYNAQETRFLTGAMNCADGKTVWFEKDEITPPFSATVASCSVPILTKVQHFKGYDLLDGGTSDPIPIEKALADGCVICIPIGIFWQIHPLYIVLCILAFVVIQADRLYTKVIAQCLLGDVFGKTGQNMLRMVIQMFLLGLGAGAAALAGVFINPGLVFPIVLIYCMIITVAMGALASLRFETMEQLV